MFLDQLLFELSLSLSHTHTHTHTHAHTHTPTVKQNFNSFMNLGVYVGRVCKVTECYFFCGFRFEACVSILQK